MKLEIAVLAGAESKAFLADLTKQIDRLERLGGTKSKADKILAEAVEEEEDETPEADEPEETEEDEDFAPKTAASKKKASSSFDEEPEAEEEEEKPKAKAKPKKLSVDDVNDACKARAQSTGGKKGIAEVRAILKKKFKTESISELKPEQFAAAIAAMEA